MTIDNFPGDEYLPDAEREAALLKFGRFIKDTAFMDFSGTDISAITDDCSVFNQLVSRLENQENIVMFNEHSYIFNPNEREERAVIQFDRISARSGQNSRHGVFFGTLFSDKYVQDVAVKIYDHNQGGAKSLVDEVVKTTKVKRSGLKTFMPVGLGAYDGNYYSFWRLERQVSTLDSVNWNHFIDDIPGNPGMSSILEKSAQTAAHLHAMGWSHVDFHPRNLAVDVTGSVFAIDWETADLEDIALDDPESRYRKSYMDLSSFMTGCYYDAEHFNAGIGIFKDIPNEESIELFESLFLNHYVTRRRSLATDIRELDDVPQLLVDLKQLPYMIR